MRAERRVPCITGRSADKRTIVGGADQYFIDANTRRHPSHKRDGPTEVILLQHSRALNLRHWIWPVLQNRRISLPWQNHARAQAVRALFHVEAVSQGYNRVF